MRGMSTSEHRRGTQRRLALSGRARHVRFGDDKLIVDLEDGRQISVPVAWFPRLVAADDVQRTRWELVGRGIGISWPDIDEDISVANLLEKDGELLMADLGMGMGMGKLAIEMVRGWRGSRDDLISRLCQGGWFADRKAAEQWLAEQQEGKTEAEKGMGARG